MRIRLRRVSRHERGLLPLVGVIKLGKSFRFPVCCCLLVDLAKGYANRLTDFNKNLAGFVHNEHVAFYKSRALSISTLVPLHLGGITEAIGLKRMQDFDFADGERDKHFSKFFAKMRTYSCLHGSINKGGL